jgi:hypothetical protein
VSQPTRAEFQRLLDSGELFERYAQMTKELEIENGNPYIFCDYVSRAMRGCVRGAGHNGPHAYTIAPLLAPVLLAHPD